MIFLTAFVKEECKMCEKKNPKEERKPLFSGNGSRDMSVSECEKAAEATFVIRELIDRMKGGKKSK